MTTKLRIDISQGLIDIEGDPELVREIYADFKTHLLGVNYARPAPPAQSGAAAGADKDEQPPPVSKSRAKRRPPVKKKTNGDESGSGVLADSPKLDKNLDTSALGAFYGQFKPKNNSEKILIFLKFLTDSLQIERPNTDQVYTCFKAMGEKIPKAFAQAFYDTSSRLGYIDFMSSTDISITISGDNHFNHSMKQKAAE
ncbi:hypothetical protein [Mangrovibrevibacter kandeliae]|uniref:hypothetical protein n=1 Tax=Mangrovibrevibacter kandeliae TaxID=2968473 RepID=UPI0021177EBF|nr:hypothetical protein [Aurantimonas sp. CSK15Z-1]MCQ8780879.1 hypothetical protein [Aurantimonas sp. CSK15Z-1]